MRKNYWLVKQEPDDYSWATFVQEGRTAWTGVRNFQARNNLRSMKAGDHVFYYHSGADKAAVGLAKVIREAYPDPTATEGDWVCVDLKPSQPLERPVTLAQMKADNLLKEMALIRQSRLSVCPVSPGQFKRLLALSKTKA